MEYYLKMSEFYSIKLWENLFIVLSPRNRAVNFIDFLNSWEYFFSIFTGSLHELLIGWSNYRG